MTLHICLGLLSSLFVLVSLSYRINDPFVSPWCLTITPVRPIISVNEKRIDFCVWVSNTIWWHVTPMTMNCLPGYEACTVSFPWTNSLFSGIVKLPCSEYIVMSVEVHSKNIVMPVTVHSKNTVMPVTVYQIINLYVNMIHKKDNPIS